MRFLLENEVYDLLGQADFTLPKYHVVKNSSDLSQSPFSSNQDVVVKGLAPELWHKSDIGLVQFHKFDPKVIDQAISVMKAQLPKDLQWSQALIVEKINFIKASSLPSEIFLSLKKDESCGWVLVWGIGGIHSELWAKQIPPLTLPIESLGRQQVTQLLQSHFVSQVLLGNVRSGSSFIQIEILDQLVNSIYSLIRFLDKESLQLLEINPLVVDDKGRFIPLDGICTGETRTHITSKASCQSLAKLFHPKSIGIVGVSKKQNSPTNIILDNAKKSSAEVRVIQDFMELEKNPVELLIVGINPKNTMSLIENILSLGKGADYIYLVTGGIGDGSDQEGYGKVVLQLFKEYRLAGKWTPTLIGPNGLGLISSPLYLNTMFIPEEKLHINYNPQSPLALMSQSGAFLITRLSSDSELQPKYAISIGSKIDLKISDLIDIFEQDSTLTTLGLYIEGFDQEEALQAALRMKKSKKKFVIYKGGRSQLGAKAAQSHTGAMMTEFGILESLFNLPNVFLCQSFTEWSVKLKWNLAYPHFQKKSPWGFITNAGYESVGSGDFSQQENYHLTKGELEVLQQQIHKHQLQNLVTPANPLDLTPMASEQVWLDCTEAMLQSSLQTLILGIVPLTQRLNTQDKEAIEQFGHQLKALSNKYNKELGLIVDSGEIYDLYRSALQGCRLPVFKSIEDASLIF